MSSTLYQLQLSTGSLQLLTQITYSWAGADYNSTFVDCQLALSPQLSTLYFTVWNVGLQSIPVGPPTSASSSSTGAGGGAGALSSSSSAGSAPSFLQPTLLYPIVDGTWAVAVSANGQWAFVVSEAAALYIVNLTAPIGSPNAVNQVYANGSYYFTAVQASLSSSPQLVYALDQHVSSSTCPTARCPCRVSCRANTQLCAVSCLLCGRCSVVLHRGVHRRCQHVCGHSHAHHRGVEQRLPRAVRVPDDGAQPSVRRRVRRADGHRLVLQLPERLRVGGGPVVAVGQRLSHLQQQHAGRADRHRRLAFSFRQQQRQHAVSPLAQPRAGADCQRRRRAELASADIRVRVERGPAPLAVLGRPRQRERAAVHRGQLVLLRGVSPHVQHAVPAAAQHWQPAAADSDHVLVGRRGLQLDVRGLPARPLPPAVHPLLHRLERGPAEHTSRAAHQRVVVVDRRGRWSWSAVVVL